MPYSINVRLKHAVWVGGILASIAISVFAWGWNFSAIAGNVDANTQSLNERKAFEIDMQKWKSGHDTLFIEQVFKAQNREKRLQVLEKNLDSKLDKILKAIEK